MTTTTETAKYKHTTLSSREIIGMALDALPGNKMSILMVMSIPSGAAFLWGVLAGLAGLSQGVAGIVSVVISLMLLSVSSAVGVLGVEAARGNETRAGMAFSYFSKTPKMIGFTALYSLAIILGLLMFIIPGLLISTAWTASSALALREDYSIVESIKVSISGLWENAGIFIGIPFYLVFLPVLGTVILAGLAVMISPVLAWIVLLAYSFSLIWLMPLMIVSYGVLYKETFL